MPINYTKRDNARIDPELLNPEKIVSDSIKAIRNKFIDMQREIVVLESENKNLSGPLNENLLHVDLEIGNFDEGKITPGELILLNKSLELKKMSDKDLDIFYLDSEKYFKQVDRYISKKREMEGNLFELNNDSKENLRNYLRNRLNGAYLLREKYLPEDEVLLAA